MTPATITLVAQDTKYTNSGTTIALQKMPIASGTSVTFISDPLPRLLSDQFGDSTVTPLGRVAQVMLGHRPLGNPKKPTKVSSVIKQTLPVNVSSFDTNNDDQVIWSISCTRPVNSNSAVVLDSGTKFVAALHTGGALNSMMDELCNGGL